MKKFEINYKKVEIGVVEVFAENLDEAEFKAIRQEKEGYFLKSDFNCKEYEIEFSKDKI